MCVISFAYFMKHVKCILFCTCLENCTKVSVEMLCQTVCSVLGGDSVMVMPRASCGGGLNRR